MLSNRHKERSQATVRPFPELENYVSAIDKVTKEFRAPLLYD